MTAVDDAFGRIEEWLNRFAPASAATLRPPAARSAISAAEQRLGVPFGSELTALLLRHDGADPASSQPLTLAGSYTPLGVSEIVSTHEMLCEALEDLNEDSHGWYWRPGWLPFAATIGADHLVLDQVDGRGVGTFRHDDHTEFDIAASLAEYLDTVAGALEEGGVAYRRRPEVVDGVLLWRPTGRPPVLPPR